MKLNTDKRHLILNSQEPNTLKIGDLNINSSSEELLGITFGYNLKFDKHIKDSCQKASQKLNTLAWLTPYMGTIKNRILMNAFFQSQFNCPIVWMCCNRSFNTMLNQLDERRLRIVYNDKKSNFNELLATRKRWLCLYPSSKFTKTGSWNV